MPKNFDREPQRIASRSDSENRDRPRTEEEISLYNLFRSTFRASQGSPELQHKIFRWLASTGHIDNIPATLPQYIADLRPPKTHAKYMGASTPAQNVAVEWKELHTIIADKDKLTNPDLIADSYLYGIVSRDNYYQITQNGRPDRKHREGVKADSAHDPYASWTRKYILNGESIGHPALDQLNASLRPVFLQKYVDIQQRGILSPFDTEIQNLVTVWQIRHPFEQFVQYAILEEFLPEDQEPPVTKL